MFPPPLFNLTKDFLHYDSEQIENYDETMLVNRFPNIAHLRVAIFRCPTLMLYSICELLQGWAPKLVTFELYFPVSEYKSESNSIYAMNAMAGVRYFDRDLATYSRRLFGLINDRLTSLKSLTIDINRPVIQNASLDYLPAIGRLEHLQLRTEDREKDLDRKSVV